MGLLTGHSLVEKTAGNVKGNRLGKQAGSISCELAPNWQG